MTLPVTREHRNLRNAIDAYQERHGSHPELEAMSRRLDSHGGGYEQDRIGVDDRTPGQKAADRVREGAATQASGGRPEAPAPDERRTTGQGAEQFGARGSRPASNGQQGAPAAHPVDRTGQQEREGRRTLSTGQDERPGAVVDRTGQSGPTQRTSRSSNDGNTGDGERESFGRSSAADRARRRFGK